MSGFSEIKEIKNVSKNDISQKLNAFEKTSKDVNEVKPLSTIREDLKGKTYPGTNVMYESHTFRLNGEKVEGVFPVFQSKFDTYLPRNLWKSGDVEQFRCCTQRLDRKIQGNPDFAKQFTARQLEQIKNGDPRIAGLTWHHNEVPGKMQLVKADVHSQCKHTGGKSLWGGGAAYR